MCIAATICGMSRPKNTQAATELGEHLRALRQRAGDPTIPDIYRHLVADVGPKVVPSDQTVLNMHNGRVNPYTVSAEALLGLMRYYDCEPIDLGPAAAERLTNLQVLIPHQGPKTGSREALVAA